MSQITQGVPDSPSKIIRFQQTISNPLGTRRPFNPIAIEAPLLDAGERSRNFEEVEGTLTEKEMRAEAMRCHQCVDAKCETFCPAHLPIRKIISLIGQGKLDEAGDLGETKNPLIDVTGRVCPQNTQCELGCNLDPPVGIGKIMRSLSERRQKHGGSKKPQLPKRGKKDVAVVGSGPGGLIGAYWLRQFGFNVDIMESLHKMGGVLMYGIPSFRLPKSIVEEVVRKIVTLDGITPGINCAVGTSISIEQLQREYDAVLFATGAGKPTTLGIEGEGLLGVLTANDYLTSFNLMRADKFPLYDTPTPQGHKAIIFGGGNTAMDAARCAKRSGYEVYIVYRRTKNEMPARLTERIHAEQEGIKLCELVTPLRFHGNKGHLIGVECVRNRLEKNKDGRPNPVVVEGSNFFIEADLAVLAVGQEPNRGIEDALAGIMTGRNGNLCIDDHMRTSIPGCFAVGDVAGNNRAKTGLQRGDSTVIRAVGDGGRAAFMIKEYLNDNWPWPTAQEFAPIT